MMYQAVYRLKHLERYAFDRLKQLSCWADISLRTSSAGCVIPEFDTLRGIAVILVLADHTSMIPRGMGGNGVWLFFTLSGYLLTLLFINRQDAWTSRGLVLYTSRRLGRILPMYWMVVVGYHVVFDPHYSWRWVSLHLLFRRGDLHLWTIQQELLFYLILPCLMFAIRSCGHSNFSKAALLYGASILSGLFLGPDILRLPAIHRFGFVPFQVAPFLAGMGAAYLFASLPGIVFRWKNGREILLLLLLALLIYCNRCWPIATGSREIWRVGIVFSLILIAVQLPGQPCLSQAFRFVPFRALGVVGYSFYLLHMPVIQHYALLLPFLGKNACFLYVCLVTYALSCLTYTLIEKPCMKLFPIWVARIMGSGRERLLIPANLTKNSEKT